MGLSANLSHQFPSPARVFGERGRVREGAVLSPRRRVTVSPRQQQSKRRPSVLESVAGQGNYDA